MIVKQLVKKTCPSGQKTFAHLSIDRCFSSLDKLKEPAAYMMYCLRYRTHVSLNEVGKSIKSEGRGRNAAKSTQSSKPTISLYDTLLSLLQDYNVAGRVEIFRLLLERRCPVPLFLPCGEHHLSVLRLLNKNVDGKTNISLGDDVTLMRVAIISCREKGKSQTSEILKEVFKLESFHREDCSKKSHTSCETAAEIGVGCVSESTIQNFLVLHVIGDFEPLWDFIIEFSDYLIVEDSPDEKDAFLRRQVVTSQNPEAKPLKDASIVIWEPSTEELSDETVDSELFSYYSLKSAIGTQLYDSLSSDVVAEGKRWKKSCDSKKNSRKCLFEMDLVDLQGMECSVSFVDKVVLEVTDFGVLREKSFLLQKNFSEQAQFEEKKAQFRNDEEQIIKMDREIRKLKQFRQNSAHVVDNHKMIVLLKEILNNPDSNVRILGTLQLEKALFKRCDALLPALRRIIEQLSAELAENLQKNNDDSRARQVQKKLQDTKRKYNETIVSIEHVWREMSHIFAANPSKYHMYPHLAAQQLIDGMCIELLDGDSNMINIPWIEATLKEVDKRLSKYRQSPRIFVLSIMGMQSSGKSTLLNIMFGIQMKTSVGMCTRGINMQLIPVVDRQEYDYILLLDTEGTRAPEYFGLPGSEKRDNQMATISILLADATIIVNSGENDAAIKEILPIVLLAYQGSELAEEKGGQMSSMLFFVYNRIDTREKDKLSNILQVLGTSLHEAFKTAYQVSGASTEQLSGVPANSSRLFQRFKLDSSNSKDSDVRILGNIKKGFTPPDDVPDPAYGEALAEFRQHIHDRVTGSPQWRSRRIIDFLTYLNLVWKCILSSDFNLNFKNVLERATYDQMNVEIKSCERQLSEEYKAKFGAIETRILISKANAQRTDNMDIEEFKRLLANEVQPKKMKLDQQIKEIFTKLGRDKWEVNSVDSWKSFEKEQENHWNGFLEKFINYQLKFDYWTDQCKKELRGRIRDIFKDEEARKLSLVEKENLFQSLYEEILNSALEKNPCVEVEDRVNNVYRKSPLIHTLPVGIFDSKSKYEAEMIIERMTKSSQVHTSRYGLFQYAADFMKMSWPFGKSNDVQVKGPEPFMEVYEELAKQIGIWIQDKNCYVDSIVDEVINITQSVLINKQLLQNKQVKCAHVFAKELTIKYMTQVQDGWEKKNSVFAKLSQTESKKEMKTYFDKASQGMVDTQLFVVMLKSNFEKILAQAFDEEMILLTIDKISSKNWLLDPKALLNYMDLELLNLISSKQLALVLEKLKQPQHFYEEVMKNLISKECPNVETEWAIFSDRLKRTVTAAASASASVDSGRAKKFLSELHLQGFQGGFRDNFLGKKFTTDSDGYDGCDNEEKEVFRQQLAQLADVVDGICRPPGNFDWKMELSSKILNRLREERTEEGVRPRCNAFCPLCKSLCTLPYGHNATRKHETFHQPKGLVGTYWFSGPRAGTLSAGCCTGEDYNFWHKDKFHSYEDFSKIFPDWLQPTFMENLPLREYIFATYHKEIAVHYGYKPSIDIPESYYHDLNQIRQMLERKTNTGNGK